MIPTAGADAVNCNGTACVEVKDRQGITYAWAEGNHYSIGWPLVAVSGGEGYMYGDGTLDDSCSFSVPLGWNCGTTSDFYSADDCTQVKGVTETDVGDSATAHEDVGGGCVSLL